MTAARRDRLAPGIPIGLLLASLAGAVGMAMAGVPVVSTGALPALVALTVVLVGLRLVGARPQVGERATAVLFWVNLAVAAAAVWLSPAYGLYVFLGYFEASRFSSPAHRVVGAVGTAAILALAQVGGPRSLLFTPVVYVAFVAVNLAVTGLMLILDGRREALFAELARTNDELRAEQHRSAALRDQLVAQAREAGMVEERSRLSREIHDTVAQDLVAIIAQLGAAGAAPAAERDRRLALVDAAARGALGEARRAVRALASPRLDDADLPLALDDLLGQWRETSGLDGELRVEGRPVASAHDDVVLRIAQEALANVARHARARRADVTLRYPGDGVGLDISDDGVGLDPDRASRGFGIAGMRSRLAVVGGTLDLQSSPGAGTTVRARVPAGGELEVAR